MNILYDVSRQDAPNVPNRKTIVNELYINS